MLGNKHKKKKKRRDSCLSCFASTLYANFRALLLFLQVLVSHQALRVTELCVVWTWDLQVTPPGDSLRGDGEELRPPYLGGQV